jgi:hypothetical protein
MCNDVDVGRQIERDLLDAAGLVQSGTHPSDVGRLDAMILLQDRAPRRLR